MASSDQCIVASLGTKRKAASPLRTSKRLRTTENGIYYDDGETELVVPAEELNDKDFRDDFMLILDKKEEPLLSREEMMEVVRNIKKDPDSLGGEFEVDGLFSDVEMKKGKVPLPAPVVDTTHTTFDAVPQRIKIGGPPKIKINIKTPSFRPKEKKNEATESETPNPTKPAPSTEPPALWEEPVPVSIKPLLRKHNLQKMHPVSRGNEVSGLCSVM
ncbi:hypothetical protein J6590_055960 [Homalodisca vitripennis]|nr:hypothetical protein J6590_091719 [Homalodisca vitripennis]KAG8306054.1 hypothetical protein J6590_055960 [Homalodisca vitripennis]